MLQKLYAFSALKAYKIIIFVDLKIASAKQAIERSHVKWTYSHVSAWNNDFEWKMFCCSCRQNETTNEPCHVRMDCLLSIAPNWT